MHKEEIDRLECFMIGLRRRNPGQPEFHQAVYEVALDIIPFIQQNAIYEEHRILERLTEPDRIVIFRVNSGGRVNYRKGANIAGFIRVADALISCGNI